MPAKAHHRSGGGLVRTHSRTSSGGSSKAGLGLQLTQKEPAAPRYPDKQTKRASHLHHEGISRTTSPVPRTNSRVRVQSKEQLQPDANRRVPQPLTSSKLPPASKQKVGFTIASPSEGGDDDDWVSSESGANTPAQDSDSDGDVRATDLLRPRVQRTTSRINGFAVDEQPTPRARSPPPLPRVDATRPPQRRDYTSQPSPPFQPALQNTPSHKPPPSVPTPVPKARSETHSPPRRSPEHRIQRQSLTRPPSTHSVTHRGETLRPHPLIRGNSYGQGLLGPAKPTPLAPLATVTTENAPAQMTASTSSSSLREISPVLSAKASSASPIMSHTSPTRSEASRQLRRTSTSSVRSSATVPVGPSASQVQLTKANHDRQRTLSSASTFAALSSLAMRSTPSPPRPAAQYLVITFPPQDQNEAIHSLLPPPYLSAHLSVLQYRGPLAESYERIQRAKRAL